MCEEILAATGEGAICLSLSGSTPRGGRPPGNEREVWPGPDSLSAVGVDAAAPPHLSSISPAEWKRIQAFTATAEGDRSPDMLLPENDPDGTPVHGHATNPVTAERCRRIRRRMSEAVTVREVVGEFPQLHRSEIFRHAYGDCGHFHTTPATASPQIRRGECHAMRAAFVEGATISEVADEWFRAENTVTRHVFGRCSHDRNPRQLSPSSVPADERARLCRTYRENAQVDVEDVAAAFRLRPEVAATVLALDDPE